MLAIDAMMHGKSLRGRLAWGGALLWVGIASAALGQLPQAKLDWVFPPGGQRGAKVEVTVAGTDLDEGREIIFSHPGIVARQRRSAADEFYPQGQPLANQFALEIAADVRPGLYDAQVVGRYGVSTPRIFHVAAADELLDNGANHEPDKPQPLKMGSLVSGRTEADVEDYYAVELKEGELLSCEVWAQRIDSAAHVWLELTGQGGAGVVVPQRWRGRDPLLEFTAPKTGVYVLRVHDERYRGGEAYIYRLEVRQQPTVDYAMPPVAPVGAEAEISVRRVKLSKDAGADTSWTARVSAPAGGTPSGATTAYPLSAQPQEVDVERFAFLPSDLSVAAEPLWLGIAGGAVQMEASESPSDAQGKRVQRIGAGEVVGQFFPSGNIDTFEFVPDASGEWVFDVYSQRLGLPTDPLLLLLRVKTDAKGGETTEQIAAADDGGARPARPGCSTTTDDPYLRVALEKDAIYRVSLLDQNSQSRAIPSNTYRLAVRRPRPDFHLLAAPASPWSADAALPLRSPLVLRAGGALVIPVVALRQDGYGGEIVVAAEGLPAGLTCEPVTLRSDKSEANVVILAETNAQPWVGPVRLVGAGVVGERPVRKGAVPVALVSDTTTAKYDRTRLSHQLVVSVAPEAAPVSLRWGDNNWEATPGGVVKGKVLVSIRAELKDAFAATTSGLPDGVTAKFTLVEDKQSAELELTVGEKVAPGAYDFLLSAKPKVLYRSNPEAVARAGDDQSRIAKLLDGFRAEHGKLAGANGSATAGTAELKQLDDRIARGEAALKEATERATKLAAAAQPAERQCDAYTNVATLRVVEKAKP